MAAPTSQLQIVAAAEVWNYVLNPSAEAPGNYTTVGTPTISRDSTYSRQVTADSTYAYKVVTGAANDGLQLTTAALPSASIYMSVWVYVASGSPAFAFKCNATTIVPTLYETDGPWRWYVLDTTAWTSGQAGGQTAVQILDTVGSATWYADDIVVSTSLCRSFHGSYPNCRWAAIAHQSKSLCKWRDEDGRLNTKSGGVLYDLDNTTYFIVSSALGLGLPEIEFQTRDTVDAGKVYQSAQLSPRVMALSLVIVATDRATQHSRRSTLIDRVAPGDVFVLRYRGNPTYRGGTADVQEIEAVYTKGLEGSFELFTENVNLTLTAYDPYFRPATETATALTGATSATLSHIVQRGYDTGWTSPGSGPGGTVYAWTVSPRNHVFAGGTAVWGWDGAAWQNLGGFTGGSAACYALAMDPAGTALYIGGGFTTYSTGGTVNNIAVYQLPAASGVTGGTISALSSGTNGLVRALAVAADASLFAGGDFTTAGGNSAVSLAKWSGSAWSALGPNNCAGSVYCLAMTSKSLFIGGNFTSAGTIGTPTGLAVSNATGSLASANWGYCITALTGDGESAATTVAASGTGATGKSLSWNAVTGATGYRVYRESSAGGGLATTCYLATVTTNSFADSGQFTLNTNVTEPSASTTGARFPRVARYDLTDNYFETVGTSGIQDGMVRGLAVAKDATTLYAVGSFTSGDGVALTRAAQYNGQRWAALGSGLNSDGYCVLVHPVTGEVVVGGVFTAADGSSASKQLAVWHPGTGDAGKWVHPDLLLPTGTVWAVGLDLNLELWAAGTFNGTGLTSAVQSLTVTGGGGGFWSYPLFYVTGPGVLRYIENQTTGHRVWFNLAVATSEIVTLDLTPGRKTIRSTRLNGVDRVDGFTDGDIGDLGLASGTNRLYLMYHTSGGAVVSAPASIKVVDPGLLLSTDA